MKISDIADCAYATDGGSIAISFRDGAGRRHSLTAVQDLIPIDPSHHENPHWRNGAILLDGEPVADPEQLRQLAEALRAQLARIPERYDRVPLPDDTVVVGDDLADYLTRDEMGRRRWLLSEAARRIDAKADGSGD